MATVEIEYLRTQLADRRHRLASAIQTSGETQELTRLVHEVDHALERMETGTYGLCDVCHDTIEKERLIADPLVRLCLDHLTPAQQRLLEQDLELAARIQRSLLPQGELKFDGWEVRHHYQPAGIVSGDYCDLIVADDRDGGLFFILGDVAGKGVAASMLMARLHAMFRSLVSVGLPVDELVARANRLLTETTISGQYATLVCGRATRQGEVELCNAGHWPPLLLRKGGVTRMEATGLPLGMFAESRYASQRLQLAPGDSLFLYTDGVSETRGPSNVEYGIAALTSFLAARHGARPAALTAACLDELKRFGGAAPPADDLTLMVIGRAA